MNNARGRDCLLGRRYAENPLTYSAKVRGKEIVSGTVTSEESLFTAIDKLLDAYKASDVTVALRRIGRGVCPKSFPVSPQSHYFLGLYHITHGGEYGLDLMHLPNEGGALDQPNIFFSSSTAISHIRGKFFGDKIKKSEDGGVRESVAGGGSHKKGIGPQSA